MRKKRCERVCKKKIGYGCPFGQLMWHEHRHIDPLSNIGSESKSESPVFESWVTALSSRKSSKALSPRSSSQEYNNSKSETLTN